MNADGSFSLSTWITGLMFTGGLIAGPGYYFYCVGFSGKNAGEYSIQRQGNSFSPVTVPLDPGMNPIAMEISAYVSGSQSDRAASIGMALDDGPTRLVAGSASFSIGKDGAGGRHSVVLERFSVPRADSYTVRFSGSAPATFSVRLSDTRLQVRRNVKLPDMKTVWWGVGILVASIVIGMFTGDMVPVKRNRD